MQTLKNIPSNDYFYMKNKNIFFLFILLLVIIGSFMWLRSQRDTISETNTQDTKKLIPEKTITHGHGLAVDTGDSNKVYIATHHGLLVLKNDRDLYAVGESNDDYMGFSPNIKDANVFFASGHPESGGNIGFQKSEDGGFTWKKISDGLDGPVDFHALTVSPINPNLIYGWYQGNLQRSVDGGKTWKKFSTSATLVALIADTQDENIVYAASPQGLFESKNQGESWERIVEGFVSAVAIHPKDNKIMIVASEKQGFAKTIDKGNTWEKIDQDFGGDSPLFLAFDHNNPATLYLLTEKNSIYKSMNAGNTWGIIR